MKNLLFLILCCLSLHAAAQPPSGYYTSANGLSGETLRTALASIIRPHTELSYTPGLWNAYYTTDMKITGKLWTIYSDVPGGVSPYEYDLGTNQCGSTSPSAEGSCYNREHTWPQSKFGSLAPMQTDLFIVYPTDYFVNFNRGDLPYGKVGVATRTFQNGSKIGNNAYPGAPGGNCYEPIDSFKGDIARNYFYITTCYRGDSTKFLNWEMASAIRLKAWSVQMLLEWHHLDPVSKKETDRNNAVYALQGNRNPFIDNPIYADCIWAGNCTVSTPQITRTENALRIYPNPATGTVNLDWANSTGTMTINVHNIGGQTVYTASSTGKTTAFSVAGWAKGIYFVQFTTPTATQVQKLVVE